MWWPRLFNTCITSTQFRSFTLASDLNKVQWHVHWLFQKQLPQLLSAHSGLLSMTCRHWLHSEMWWPRLFKAHTPIAWDDYEKDYSDLPREVLQQHHALEGAKEATRHLEASEASIRASLEVRLAV